MKKIALIEDDSDLYALLKYNLEKEGFTLVGSQTGKGAIELCRRERPDLILLDIMLPDSDGLDLCKGIRGNPELAQQVQRILALQESYPDLKASDNFLALQRDLVGIEDQLQYARRFYNGAVRDLNNKVEAFPSVLVARVANFKAAEFFRQGDGQEAPQ